MNEVILHYIEILISGRKIFLSVFFLLNFSMLIYLLLLPPLFTSSATILPETTNKSSILSDFASITGLNIGSNQGGSEDLSLLYEPILKSRKIVNTLLLNKFKSNKFKNEQSLLDILQINGDSLSQRLEIGYEILSSMLVVDLNIKTQVIKLSIETVEPMLSSLILSEFIGELSKYFKEVNFQRATENRIFIEGRIDETILQLELTEDKLKLFREANKRVERSPELLLKQGRLLREVRVQEELYLTLKKEFEILKIDEVKSKKILRVLDNPVPAIYKSNPRRKRIMVITFVFGLIIAFGITVGHFRFTKFYRENNLNVKLRELVSPIIKDYKSMFGVR